MTLWLGHCVPWLPVPELFIYSLNVRCVSGYILLFSLALDFSIAYYFHACLSLISHKLSCFVTPVLFLFSSLFKKINYPY